MTQEMVDKWSQMMDELGRLLRGEVLIPFWRDTDEGGINVRKVFLQPRTLDLALWVQGTAATPYLEHGKMTDTKMWRHLPDAFGRNFPGFAIWFN